MTQYYHVDTSCTDGRLRVLLSSGQAVVVHRLEQAQATNDLDEAFYSHGVFDWDPAVVERQAALKSR